MRFKEHSIFLLVLALFTSCHLFLQSPDQTQPEQMAQLPPSLAEIPIALDLAKTFSDTTLGLSNNSDAAFEQYSDGHPLHESMLWLRKLILRFQNSLSVDIDSLNETLVQPRKKYLAGNLQSLYSPTNKASLSVASKKGSSRSVSITWIMSSTFRTYHSQFTLYRAQNPIFVNRDLTALQTTITENAQKCTGNPMKSLNLQN